jgi:hypothetical protein
VVFLGDGLSLVYLPRQTSLDEARVSLEDDIVVATGLEESERLGMTAENQELTLVRGREEISYLASSACISSMSSAG